MEHLSTETLLTELARRHLNDSLELDRVKSQDIEFTLAVLRELTHARRKFPSPVGLLATLTEETGEVARAMLDKTPNALWGEAVQVAAMACRIATEGDPSLDAYPYPV